MAEQVSVNEMIEAMKDVIEVLDEASAEESRAASKKTDSIKQLNDMQKQFDKHVDELRNAAPKGTDWWSFTRKNQQSV